MKTWYAWATPSGPINLMKAEDMPPSHHSEGWYKKYCESHNHANPEQSYQADLQAAKKSSVPIQNEIVAVSLIAHGQTILDLEKAKAHYCKLGEVYGPFTVEYEIKTVLSPGWVPSYNDPDNINGHPNAEPMEVAILLPEKEPQEYQDIEAEAHLRYPISDDDYTTDQMRRAFIEGAKFTITRKQ